ncbi:hypothetical protein [Pseudoalteromonas denitrificans]|uniref:Uncharacterized protein n=1 Tax=Pseudoalteromonas denitrificans DSM 6059 TaxID=1123010 RepID=A0A1I1UMG7_9GAMM|nr:hypothetical protein [Pseudoalteromonas denitrificans]SFD71986.1 hypothetical protein SAMN02745724_05281 [Pseudoalteromonas denitrificans DSM 6059]
MKFFLFTTLISMTLSVLAFDKVNFLEYENYSFNISESEKISILSSSMNLENFKKAISSKGKCFGIAATGYSELNYAFKNNLISYQAYNWGWHNHYYPIIDRNNFIDAVCPFTES